MERLARNWLKRESVHSPPVPTSIVSLADETHPIETRQIPLKICHGSLWHLRDGWVIQLNRDDTIPAQRFTLFHEAFHILAHRKATPLFRKPGSTGKAFNELLADSFAARILMPAKWVEEKWEEIKDLDQMARIFQVPKSSMCIRLRSLGLL